MNGLLSGIFPQHCVSQTAGWNVRSVDADRSCTTLSVLVVCFVISSGEGICCGNGGREAGAH